MLKSQSEDSKSEQIREMGHGDLTRPVRYIVGEELKLPGAMVCPPKCYALSHCIAVRNKGFLKKPLRNKGSISMTAHGAALGC